MSLPLFPRLHAIACVTLEDILGASTGVNSPDESSLTVPIQDTASQNLPPNTSVSIPATLPGPALSSTPGSQPPSSSLERNMQTRKLSSRFVCACASDAGSRRCSARYCAFASTSDNSNTPSWFSTFPSYPRTELFCLPAAFEAIGLTIPNMPFTHPRLCCLADSLASTLVLRSSNQALSIAPFCREPVRFFLLHCSDDFCHVNSVEAIHPSASVNTDLASLLSPHTHWPFYGSLASICLAKKRGRRSRNRRSRPSGRGQVMNFFEKTDRVQKYSPLDFQVVRVTKLVERANIITSTGSATFTSFNFQLADCSDVAEMTAVFDQYRIDRIDMRIVPNITESLSSTPVLGRNYSAIDLDDANAFTSLTDALDYNNVQVWEPTNPIQLTFIPRFAYAAFASGVFSSFANSKPRWIDAASTGVQHYGVKLAFGVTSTAITYTVTCRYHISFRMAH